jgi:hypothetical protein
MFYFSALKSVGEIETNYFFPGAIVDHLSSAGAEWNQAGENRFKAGANASYGAVTDSCNYPGKFPMPAIVIYHYL